MGWVLARARGEDVKGDLRKAENSARMRESFGRICAFGVCDQIFFFPRVDK